MKIHIQFANYSMWFDENAHFFSFFFVLLTVAPFVIFVYLSCLFVVNYCFFALNFAPHFFVDLLSTISFTKWHTSISSHYSYCSHALNYLLFFLKSSTRSTHTIENVLWCVFVPLILLCHCHFFKQHGMICETVGYIDL